LSKGFGVERVQDWIGHANIQSTMEYAKVTNARRDARIATGDAPHGWSSNTLSFREGTDGLVFGGAASGLGPLQRHGVTDRFDFGG